MLALWESYLLDNLMFPRAGIGWTQLFSFTFIIVSLVPNYFLYNYLFYGLRFKKKTWGKFKRITNTLGRVLAIDEVCVSLVELWTCCLYNMASTYVLICYECLIGHYTYVCSYLCVTAALRNFTGELMNPCRISYIINFFKLLLHALLVCVIN